MSDTTKLIIGRREIVDFPQLELLEIEAKVDTGAYTSSFHCHHVEEVERNNQTELRCYFLDPSHPEYNNKEVYFSSYTTKKVKSSNGITETRYKVKTNIIIFNKTMPIELTLTERSNMRYSVLLGRKFLKKRFIVDTEFLHLSQKNKLIACKFYNQAESTGNNQ